MGDMSLIRFAPAAVVGLVLALMPALPAGAEDTVDEIHFSYGDVPGSVVVNWRGAETSISYGLTEAYGLQAVAAPSAITPVDSAGPYQEVVLTGLAPDSAYHYRIGTGVDHVLRTAPTGSFRWVDVGGHREHRLQTVAGPDPRADRAARAAVRHARR